MGSDRYADLRRAAVNAQHFSNPWVLAAYTAAAEPAVVLRLLDELDGLVARVKQLEETTTQQLKIDPGLLEYVPDLRSELAERAHDAILRRDVEAAERLVLEQRPGHPDGGSTT